ncbi:MAG: hypothetical protein HC927_09055 [Deltaproteobacteria bacterium]|nr:hypothetical protein [Deltaproteobacteria bacterium]
MTLGVTNCPICGMGPISHQYTAGRWLNVGNTEIRIFGKGICFAAPNLLPHFVEIHNYALPTVVMRAILEDPAPLSVEYEERLKWYLEGQGLLPVSARFSPGPWQRFDFG